LTQGNTKEGQPKETQVIKASGQAAISQILSVNISLQSNKNTGATMGIRKTDEVNGSGTENQRKKQVTTVCTSLFLNNNEIRTINGLRDILNYVVWEPSNLEWLDLSYNYLQSIEKEI
jgi:hypothetical protein